VSAPSADALRRASFRRRDRDPVPAQAPEHLPVFGCPPSRIDGEGELVDPDTFPGNIAAICRSAAAEAFAPQTRAAPAEASATSATPPPLNAILSPNLTTPNDPHDGQLFCFSTKKTPFGKEPGRPPPKGVIARQSLQGSHADPGLSGKDIMRPAERKAHSHQPFCKFF